MYMPMDRNEMNSFFIANLNTYHGIAQDIQFDDENNYCKKIIDIRWRGDVHFIFYYSVSGYGYYAVERDGQKISATYWIRKFKAEDIVHMQRLINDIESGRYNKKKTLKESIKDKVEKCGLTSYMNATKWKELIGELEKRPDISFMYKSLFDAISPEYYWDIRGDEDIEYMNWAVIEWMKINPYVVETEYIGRLVKPNVTSIDLSLEVKGILKKHSIPYEYDDVNGIYIIFGWK